MDGKSIRLGRIMENNRAVIIPLDHGTTDGPVAGLKDMNQLVPKTVAGGATAVLLHKGIIKSLREVPSCGTIMHLSVSTKLAADPNNKVLVSSVEEAIRLGMDAVSVHVNIGGSDAEPEMLQILGNIAAECDRMQMPLLAMMYARGKNIKGTPDEVALAARIGGELGADIVKTSYTGDVESFREVVEGCPVPVVIAGGPKLESNREVLEMVRDALAAGAIGISMGRNVYEHKNPEAMVKALRAIIVDNASVDEALELMAND